MIYYPRLLLNPKAVLAVAVVLVADLLVAEVILEKGAHQYPSSISAVMSKV